MSDLAKVEGRRLVTFDKKAPATILLVQAVLFFVGGIVATAIGYPLGLFFTAISPVLFWFSRSLGSASLIVTDLGVYYLKGKGFSQTPKLITSARWPSVDGVELVTERKTSGDSSSTSHTLVFSRGEEKPLRYLLGFKQRKRLVELIGICKERQIPIKI